MDPNTNHESTGLRHGWTEYPNFEAFFEQRDSAYVSVPVTAERAVELLEPNGAPDTLPADMGGDDA